MSDKEAEAVWQIRRIMPTCRPGCPRRDCLRRLRLCRRAEPFLTHTPESNTRFQYDIIKGRPESVRDFAGSVR
ncbi:MAG: hypothetical protein K0S66_2251 [Sphingomonas sp.]|jgi:hypothetical protein|nr:hypothetical protein [Sphingomonas sp.]